MSQVLDLRAEEIGEPPPFGTSIRVDYIVGMGKVGKKFVLILDIDGVLSADELMSVTAAATPQDGQEAGDAEAAAADQPEQIEAA